MRKRAQIIIMISANAEWQVVRNYYNDCLIRHTPFGEWFTHQYNDTYSNNTIVFMHGGWGKVSAASSTQYAIDKFHPELIINLGTCGGFEGEINRGDIILVEKTIIYDIYELMGDPEEHITHYITEIDNSWISKPYPIPVRPSILISGDRDIFPNEIPQLKEKFRAISGDWESGAIAWVCQKNQLRCLILRGVTDLIGRQGGEAYDGKIGVFYENTAIVMTGLVDSLPMWIAEFYRDMYQIADQKNK